MGRSVGAAAGTVGRTLGETAGFDFAWAGAGVTGAGVGAGVARWVAVWGAVPSAGAGVEGDRRISQPMIASATTASAPYSTKGFRRVAGGSSSSMADARCLSAVTGRYAIGAFGSTTLTTTGSCGLS